MPRKYNFCCCVCVNYSQHFSYCHEGFFALNRQFFFHLNSADSCCDDVQLMEISLTLSSPLLSLTQWIWIVNASTASEIDTDVLASFASLLFHQKYFPFLFRTAGKFILFFYFLKDIHDDDGAIGGFRERIIFMYFHNWKD